MITIPYNKQTFEICFDTFSRFYNFLVVGCFLETNSMVSSHMKIPRTFKPRVGCHNHFRNCRHTNCICSQCLIGLREISAGVSISRTGYTSRAPSSSITKFLSLWAVTLIFWCVGFRHLSGKRGPKSSSFHPSMGLTCHVDMVWDVIKIPEGQNQLPPTALVTMTPSHPASSHVLGKLRLQRISFVEMETTLKRQDFQSHHQVLHIPIYQRVQRAVEQTDLESQHDTTTGFSISSGQNLTKSWSRIKAELQAAWISFIFQKMCFLDLI